MLREDETDDDDDDEEEKKRRIREGGTGIEWLFRWWSDPVDGDIPHDRSSTMMRRYSKDRGLRWRNGDNRRDRHCSIGVIVAVHILLDVVVVGHGIGVVNEWIIVD